MFNERKAIVGYSQMESFFKTLMAELVICRS